MRTRQAAHSNHGYLRQRKRSVPPTTRHVRIPKRPAGLHLQGERKVVSLDVYLTGETRSLDCICRCGHKHQRDESEEFFSANITHNLAAMASEAGIYEALWRPEENGFTKAFQLVAPLSAGLRLIKSDPDRFKKHNAKNGWGLYEHFVPWVERYLAACSEYPHARVNASR